MNTLEKREEIYAISKKTALELIRLATKETEAQQINRYMNDAVYSKVIDEIANIYFLVQTDEAFQKKNEEVLLRLSMLFGIRNL